MEMAKLPAVTRSAEHTQALMECYQLLSGVFAGLQGSCNNSDHFSLSFRARRISKPEHTPEGVLTVQAKLSPDSERIGIKFELIRVPKSALSISRPYDFFRELASLAGPATLVPFHQEEALNYIAVWAEVTIHAMPLSPTRESNLLAQIDALKGLSGRLNAHVSTCRAKVDLDRVYAKFEDHVGVIYPLPLDLKDVPSELLVWAERVHDYLSAGLSVALAAPNSAVGSYCLSLLALVGTDLARPIGYIKAPVIPDPQLIALVESAPGVLSVKADQVHLGVQSYEKSSCAQSLLTRVKSVVFWGTHERLQVLFQGGQGDFHDPLSPVVVHAPRLSLEALTRHTVGAAAQRGGGLPPGEQATLCDHIVSCLRDCETSQSFRLLPKLTDWAIHTRTVSGARAGGPRLPEFATRLKELNETLGGLSAKPKQQRSGPLQERLLETLSGDELLSFFTQHLFCQDTALEEVVSRLRAESLTRPGHQPIRLCFQGTPSSGKSQCAVLLARKLGIPYVNFDAASMSDHHTAISQLLGSGRGIVHSDKCGRLEEAAKHFQGAVIECSDLDHAPPSVRPVVADVFLQALENGEAQSSMGNLFSCANLILIFTMNLADGADESVRKKVGFQNTLTRMEVRGNVMTHIKEMLSSAFLSRVGTPILFESLSGPALASIVEREIVSSVALAANRHNLSLGEVRVATDVGRKFVARLRGERTILGARELLELSRSAVAEAFFCHKKLGSLSGKPLHVTLRPDGSLKFDFAETSESE